MKIAKMITCVLFLALSFSNPAQAGDKKESSTIVDDFLKKIGADKDPDPDGAFVIGGTGQNLPGIQVYDAENNYLGLLVDLGSGGESLAPLIVYNHKLKSFVKFNKVDGSIVEAARLFATPGCSGNPYVNIVNIYSVRKSCNTYYTGERTKSERILIYSYQVGEDCVCNSIGGPDGTYYDVVPAIEVPSQYMTYYDPVSLPIQFKAKIKSVED